MLIKTLKIKLKPNNKQETKMFQFAGAKRFAYNWAIAKEQENYKEIKSPMVGTFYASSSPKAEPFVKVGDKVKKGQVVCIVEAMKLMNEIESEFDGEVVEICKNNEEMVEYGDILIKLK